MVNKKSTKKKPCPKGSRRNSTTGRCRKVKSNKSVKKYIKKSIKSKKSVKKKSVKKKSRKKLSKSKKTVKKKPKKLFKFTVNVYKNDIDNNANYTYKNPSKLSEKKKVISAIKKAMIGFENLNIEFIKDNKYMISTTGPDSSTSNEMRNLAQMGEFTDYIVKKRGSYILK